MFIEKLLKSLHECFQKKEVDGLLRLFAFQLEIVRTNKITTYNKKKLKCIKNISYIHVKQYIRNKS